VALAGAGVALGQRLIGAPPFLLFAATAAASAALGGAGPGVVAVLLGGLASDYFFLPPRYVLVLDGRTLWLAGVYALGGFVSHVTAHRRSGIASRSPPDGQPPARDGGLPHERNGRA
jgi:hypothetical protein